MTARASGRTPSDLRPTTFTRDYTEMAMGSVLVEFGRTRVLVHGVGRDARAAVVEGDAARAG